MIDLATRAHNHNYGFDPIVRSLLDTDFYKFLMLQFIWKLYKDVPVTFEMKNRTKSVRLADHINLNDLEDQLHYVSNLKFTNSELIWLKGNSFYGKDGMFEPDFIEALKTFELSDYALWESEGQIYLTFDGPWFQTTMWEIYSLSIVNELRNRTIMQSMSKFELDIMYARAKSKLWNKLQVLDGIENLNLADFGTRRRHSFLWQEWAVEAAQEALGSKFTGTSNAYLAMKHDLEAIGTNAHELPMVLAALSNDDAELKFAQYELLQLWEDIYGERLTICLPDTFGTTQFLKRGDAADWKGFRFDSKEPIAAGEEAIAFWKKFGKDPTKKLGLFSDGLDATDILMIENHFRGKIQLGFGWGTLFTNDFRECSNKNLDPISLVCKVTEANGRPCVKLSDNFAKATGDKEEIERYWRVFGVEGIADAPVEV